MRKNVFGRQLGRDTNERKALFKSLSSSLVIHERIKTTEEKAKAVKPYIEKLVTKAKNISDKLHAYSLLQPHLTPQAVKKLMTDIAPRFKDRPGGYTRIIKIGQRFSDNAPMVCIEWVEKRPLQTTQMQEEKKSKVAKNKQFAEIKKNLKSKEKTQAKKVKKVEKKEDKSTT